MVAVSRRQFLHWTLTASIGVLAACQAPAAPPAATAASPPTAAPAATPPPAVPPPAKPASLPAPPGAPAANTQPAAAETGGQRTIAIAEDPDTLDPQKTAAAV